MRPAGDGAARRGRGGRGGRAHHPRGDRPAADLRAHARGRRSGVRDGGLLARSRPAPRRRDPLRRQGLHQPDPGPPGLPRRHGGLLRRQAAAVHRRGRLARAGDRGRDLGGQPRRRLRPPPRRRARGGEVRRGTADVLGIRSRGRPVGARGQLRRLRGELRGRDTRGRAAGADAAAWALQRGERARRPGRRRTPWAWTYRPPPRRSPRPIESPGASSRSTRASRSRCWSTTRTRRTRWRTC